MKPFLYSFFVLLFTITPSLGQPVPKTAPVQDRFLDIQEIKSPGGMTAWLVEDHTLPIISLQFAFKEAGSARDTKEYQGLARLVSNTMDEGAGDLDSQAFQKTLADHSIGLSFDVGRDNFVGSLKTLTRHKVKAFELMQLALNEPRFDQEAIERMRAANIARIKSSMTEPDWIAARFQNDIAYAGHPYALNSGGTISSLRKITRDDLASFVKANLTRDRLFIGVAGDITPTELKMVLDQLFLSLPGKAVTTPLSDISVQGLGKTFLYMQDIPQSFINILQPGIDQKDPDYYAASIMNFVLGGSGFGSRLTEEVREKRGLTYGIHSGLQHMDHVNDFAVSLSTENKNAGHALKLIHQEITRMRDTPITEKELADAKSYITGSLPLSFSSTDAIASNILWLQVDNYPIDHFDRYPDMIRAITIEDVQRVSRRLLTPDNMLTIVVGQPAGVEATEILTSLPNVE